MTEQKFKSLADLVFERLESDILTGVYEKGTILSEGTLSRELEVSRTPIREAIRRLAQENLVKETPKGHVVCGVTTKDICDIYEIRMKIEGDAAFKCASNISDSELDKMLEVIELQEFYTFKGEADKIKLADTDFHSIIYNNCGSEIYSDILATLHRKVQLGRKASVSDGERAKCAVKEHREIYLALKNRDAKLAEALVIQHINNAKISIMRLK